VKKLLKLIFNLFSIGNRNSGKEYSQVIVEKYEDGFMYYKAKRIGSKVFSYFIVKEKHKDYIAKSAVRFLDLPYDVLSRIDGHTPCINWRRT
jgi:hypothetical protein